MVMPYLSFTGQCEEAFGWYAEIFGGKIRHIVKYGEAPAMPGMPVGEAQKDKVMHAEVMLTESGGISGADALWPVPPGGAVAIHAFMDGEAQAERVFAALAEGGEVVAPLQPNPPPDDAGVSGTLCDKYGFNWIVSAMREP